MLRCVLYNLKQSECIRIVQKVGKHWLLPGNIPYHIIDRLLKLGSKTWPNHWETIVLHRMVHYNQGVT